MDVCFSDSVHVHVGSAALARSGVVRIPSPARVQIFSCDCIKAMQTLLEISIYH